MTLKKSSGEITSANGKIVAAEQQEGSITVNGDYRGGIKLFTEDGHTLKGHIIADEINNSGINVELVYTNINGNQEEMRSYTDRNGRFNSEYNALMSSESVIAKAQLQTPANNRLDIISRLIPAIPYSDNCIKTEDALNYLVTENDECFIVEI